MDSLSGSFDVPPWCCYSEFNSDAASMGAIAAPCPEGGVLSRFSKIGVDQTLVRLSPFGPAVSVVIPSRTLAYTAHLRRKRERDTLHCLLILCAYRCSIKKNLIKLVPEKK